MKINETRCEFEGVVEVAIQSLTPGDWKVVATPPGVGGAGTTDGGAKVICFAAAPAYQKFVVQVTSVGNDIKHQKITRRTC